MPLVTQNGNGNILHFQTKTKVKTSQDGMDYINPRDRTTLQRRGKYEG